MLELADVCGECGMTAQWESVTTELRVTGPVCTYCAELLTVSSALEGHRHDNRYADYYGRQWSSYSSPDGLSLSHFVPLRPLGDAGAAEILESAADLLESAGWCPRRTFGLDASMCAETRRLASTEPMSASSALEVATLALIGPDEYAPGGAAIAALKNWVGLPHWELLSAWEKGDTRTQEEIVTALRSAAALSRAVPVAS